MNRRTSATTIRRRPRGFTLLEVMLGLALSALVLVAVNTAIHIQLQVTNSSRGGVEETQLARALLNRIAEDLRGAVLYQVPNPEELTVDYAVDEAATEEGTEEDSEATTEETEETEEEETGPSSYPGLVGTLNELQVDTCRLPRPDELAAALTSDLGVASQLSDVKSVAYFVAGEQRGQLTTATGALGLVRREFDRAAAAWAVDNGNASALNDDGEPIAEEVYAIEFHYYDETGEAYDEWDSYELGGLPIAVEIVLYVVPARVRARMAAEASRSALNRPTLNSDERLLAYRLLVRLPTARPIPEETTEEETTEETTDEEATTEDTEAASE